MLIEKSWSDSESSLAKNVRPLSIPTKLRVLNDLPKNHPKPGRWRLTYVPEVIFRLPWWARPARRSGSQFSCTSICHVFNHFAESSPSSGTLVPYNRGGRGGMASDPYQAAESNDTTDARRERQRRIFAIRT